MCQISKPLEPFYDESRVAKSCSYYEVSWQYNMYDFKNLAEEQIYIFFQSQ